MTDNTAQQLLDLVRRNYQEIARGFDLTRRKEIWPEIKDFAQGIKEGSRILDAGCGNGRLLEALKGKQVEYLGFDSSPKLINLARQNYPDKEFIIGDVLHPLATGGKNFDYIFCLAVLPHVPGKELRSQALENLASKLADGGTLVISVWNFWKRSYKKKYKRLLFKATIDKIRGKSELDYGDIIFPWRGREGMNSLRYYHAFTRTGLKKLVRLSNLDLIELKSYGYNYWLVLRKKDH